MRSDPADAEALFGSAARQDGDRLSDLDYLIVGDDSSHLRLRKEWLTKQGFSVSDFTWRRLEKACDCGTLFSIHLKLEAKIVFDTKSRLRELLSDCTPKADYSQELEHSLELFRPLEHIPSGPEGRAWALDTLSVAFRNAAILTFANSGRYLFSMNSIIGCLKSDRKINDEGADFLQRLRKFKSGYRSGYKFNVETGEYRNILSSVGCALGVEFDSKQMRVPVHPLAVSDNANSTSAYSAMRAIEAELIAIPQSLKRIDRVRELEAALLGKIRNPHAYLWTFMQGSADLKGQLNELRAYY